MSPMPVLKSPRMIGGYRRIPTAVRDGINADLIDARGRGRQSAAARLDELLEACRPHAQALGCKRELELVAGLAGDPGPARQRAAARGGLAALLRTLEAEFPP